MKFCKVLEGQDKDIPEFNHIVLRYKQLKKKIKALPKLQPAAAAEAGPDAAAGDAPALMPSSSRATTPTPPPEDAAYPTASRCASGLSCEEQDFMSTLNEDVSRFNAFFMEKEEDAVIRLQSIEEQLEGVADAEQLNEIRGRLVNFHGELVMILHWSLINYSAIVKILKKHDKRSGVLLRAPYLANVLTQPFSSTNVMSRLVKRAEELAVAATEQQDPRPKRQKLAVGSEPAPSGSMEEVMQVPGPFERASTTQSGGVQQEQAAEFQRQQLPKLQVVQGGVEAGLRWDSGGASGGASGAAAPSNSSDDEASSLTEVSPAEEPAIRRTKLALQMWQLLAKSASTPSTILHAEGSAAPTPAAQQYLYGSGNDLLQLSAHVGGDEALQLSGMEGEVAGEANGQSASVLAGPWAASLRSRPSE